MQIKIDEKVIFDDEVCNSSIEKNKKRKTQLIELVREKLESTLREVYTDMCKIKMAIGGGSIQDFYFGGVKYYYSNNIFCYRFSSKYTNRYIYVTNNRIRYFEGYTCAEKEIDFCEANFDMKYSGCMTLDIVVQQIEYLQNNKNKILEEFTKHIVSEIEKNNIEVAEEVTRLNDIETRLKNLK